MIRRVNFTGRRRIPRKRVTIELVEASTRSFHATIDLGGYDFPPDAAVFLEVTSAGSSQQKRFPFGTVGAPAVPENCELAGDWGEEPFFTLKVVDQSARIGRLLGIAERIRPVGDRVTAARRRGILAIESRDLGQKLWEVAADENDVTLFVNSAVPDLRDRVRCDPLFYAAIFPEVVRQVLAKALDEPHDDDDQDCWSARWLRFGRDLHPQQEEPPTRAGQDEERREWTEEIVTAFCDKHQLVTKYLQAQPGGTGGRR